jgi:hypothetical protein
MDRKMAQGCALVIRYAAVGSATTTTTDQRFRWSA